MQKRDSIVTKLNFREVTNFKSKGWRFKSIQKCKIFFFIFRKLSFQKFWAGSYKLSFINKGFPHNVYTDFNSGYINEV